MPSDSAEAEVRDGAKAAAVIRLRTAERTAPAAERFTGTAHSRTVQLLLDRLRSMEIVREERPVRSNITTEPSASDEQDDGETAMTDNQRRQTMEEPPDAVSADGELTVREEWGDSAQEPYAPELFKTETVFEETPADDMPLDDVLKKPLVRTGIRPVMRLRLLRNDRELPSREELKKQTFNNSSDFFEEAPDRLSGVATSGELAALDEPEDEPPKKQRTGAAIAQRLGDGVKSAGVHVGYFVTNVGRAVKRRRVLSERKKAEEERRRRQMERRRQERAAMERRRAGYGTPKQTNDDNRKQ